MSSILTNTAAMTALQTLKQTNKKMDITQNRISTGMRISEASHNAAYWSIATTMRSDNSSMSTVQDALGLGAAQVDVAYMAMDNVKDKLDAIKSRLVAASQPDVDRAKIQEEITQLQDDLRTSAAAATFSGGNWLNVDETGTQQVVASFVREANAIRLETIDIDTSKTALFVNGSEDEHGLLEDTIEVGGTIPGLSGFDGNGEVPATGSDNQITIANFGNVDWENGDTVTFTVSIEGTETDVTGDVTVDGDGMVTIGFSNQPSGITVVYDDDSGELTIGIADDAGPEGVSVTVGGFAGLRADADPDEVSVTSFDITELNRGDLQTLLNHVDKTLERVITAASDLGAIKTRIESQTTFVSKLMDAVERGVGQLVDADMEQESTRLQALQTQQQLGIQALSIANANSQNILALFG